MMASVAVTLAVYWVDVEPDGSECVVCGDRCYIGQRELVAAADGGPIVFRSGHFKCVACEE